MCFVKLVYQRGHWHGVLAGTPRHPLHQYSFVGLFDWNPLFHCVDQVRGTMFITYSSMHSNLPYPLKVALVAVVRGLMGEFFT